MNSRSIPNFTVRPLPGQNSQHGVIATEHMLAQAITAAHQHYQIYQEDTGVYDDNDNHKLIYTADGDVYSYQYIVLTDTHVIGRLENIEEAIQVGEKYKKMHPGFDTSEMRILTVFDPRCIEGAITRMRYIVSEINGENHIHLQETDAVYDDPEKAIHAADVKSNNLPENFGVTVVLEAFEESDPTDIVVLGSHVLYKHGQSRDIDSIGIFTDDYDESMGVKMTFQQFMHRCACGMITSYDGFADICAVHDGRMQRLSNIGVSIDGGFFYRKNARGEIVEYIDAAVFYPLYVMPDEKRFCILWYNK